MIVQNRNERSAESLRFPVVVKRSSIDGRGVFALSNIPARRKVGEFLGQQISREEARRRARKRRKIQIVEISSSIAIDASVNGNALRYINHSCAANMYMRRAYGKVEFYANRPIGVGEELTCDYGETHHNRTRRCHCGSDLCRGYI